MEYSRGLKTYFAYCKEFKPLLILEEQDLAARIQEGDKFAKDKLIRHNLNYANSLAIKEAHKRNVLEHLEDLVQEAGRALIRAAENYEFRGNKFISYAKDWILAYIRNYLASNKLIRKSANQNREASLMIKAESELEKSLARLPTSEEVAEYLTETTNKKYTAGLVEAVNELYRTTTAISFDASYGSDEGNTLHEIIEDPNVESEEAKITRQKRDENLRGVLAKFLPDIEREVLELLYLSGKSLTDISQILSLTTEQVRQKREQAIRRLRSLDSQELQKIRSYM